MIQNIRFKIYGNQELRRLALDIDTSITCLEMKNVLKQFLNIDNNLRIVKRGMLVNDNTIINNILNMMDPHDFDVIFEQ